MFYLCHNRSLWSTWYISYPWLMKLSTQAMFIFFFFSYCISPQTNKLYNFWFLFIFFFLYRFVAFRFAFFFIARQHKILAIICAGFPITYYIYHMWLWGYTNLGQFAVINECSQNWFVYRSEHSYAHSTHSCESSRIRNLHALKFSWILCVIAYPSPALSTSLLIEWAVPSPPPPLLILLWLISVLNLINNAESG